MLTGSRRLVLAVLLPFVAAAVQGWLWDDLIRPYVWFLFFPAAFGSAWLAGWRGGLAGTAVGAGLVWYFFMPPTHSFGLETHSAKFSIAAFLLMGGLFAWFFERYRRTQQQLTARYDQTFDAAPVGMAELDAQGRWQRVNDRFCEILGYPRERLLREGPEAIFLSEDPAAQPRPSQCLLGDESRLHAREQRYQRADGAIGWVQLTVSAVTPPRGERPSQFLAVIEDIGARKAAEQALHQSEQRFRDLVEQANSAILHWSVDGKITYANAFAQRLFGWTAEELIGQPVGMLVPERESTGQDLSSLVADIAAHPERFRSTVNENVCRDGRRLWMTWTNSAVRDADGRVGSILAVGNDVTELRSVRSALRASEDRIRFVLDAARIGSWELDLETGAALRSSLHDEVFGYPQRAPSWSFDDFLAHVLPDDLEQVRDSHRSAAANGTVWNIECRVRRVDGQVRWIWIAGMPLKQQGGRAQRMTGIAQDITDRKRAEIQLQRHSDELRRRNDELERFNRASIGRELRMVELKQEVNELALRLGEAAPYDVGFTAPPGVAPGSGGAGAGGG